MNQIFKELKERIAFAMDVDTNPKEVKALFTVILILLNTAEELMEV